MFVLPDLRQFSFHLYIGWKWDIEFWGGSRNFPAHLSAYLEVQRWATGNLNVLLYFVTLNRLGWALSGGCTPSPWIFFRDLKSSNIWASISQYSGKYRPMFWPIITQQSGIDVVDFRAKVHSMSPPGKVVARMSMLATHMTSSVCNKSPPILLKPYIETIT